MFLIEIFSVFRYKGTVRVNREQVKLGGKKMVRDYTAPSQNKLEVHNVVKVSFWTVKLRSLCPLLLCLHRKNAEGYFASAYTSLTVSQHQDHTK